MTFALMQPYFFPYIGYFSMIHSVDHFMFFDDVQYVKRSWMSRNRLLNLNTGDPFFIRPELRNVTYKDKLLNVQLREDEKWKLKLLDQCKGYKTRPHALISLSCLHWNISFLILNKFEKSFVWDHFHTANWRVVVIFEHRCG